MRTTLACRTRETLEVLRGLLSSLAGASTPPTMIFFSAGLSVTTRTTGKMGTSNCDLSTDAFQNVGTAAAEARAHVYVVQADLDRVAEERWPRESCGRHRSSSAGAGGRRRQRTEPHRTRDLRLVSGVLPARAIGTQRKAASRRAPRHAAGRHGARRDTDSDRPRRRRERAQEQRQPARHVAGSHRVPRLAASGRGLRFPRRRRQAQTRGARRARRSFGQAHRRRCRRLRRERQVDGAVDRTLRIARNAAADVCRHRPAGGVPDTCRGDRRLRPQRNSRLRHDRRPHLRRRAEVELAAPWQRFRRVQALAAVQERAVGDGDLRSLWQAARRSYRSSWSSRPRPTARRCCRRRLRAPAPRIPTASS